MEDINLNNKRLTLFFIFLTFLFGVVARLYWIGWASNHEYMMHNGILMINTNDGYAFAEGARDIIAGFHQPNDLSYVNHSMAKFTAFIDGILPFDFENIILYMSVFLSSLLVVPIILIAREYKSIEAGVIAAFTSVIAMSYYNRTMAGYYDTDMLNIVLPMFVLWGMIRVSLNNYTKSSIIAPMFVLASLWWYPSSFTLNAAFLGIFILYTFIVFLFKYRNSKDDLEHQKYLASYQTIILFLIALTNLAFIIKFIAIVGLYALFFKGVKLKTLNIIAVSCACIFILLGGLNPIFFQLRFYILRHASEIKTISYQFFNVNQTIQESGLIDYHLFMDRISSSAILFILSCVGYIIFCFKHRSFLLTLPMLGLGFLALKAGLRFTIYAVPITGLGLGFLFSLVLDILKVNNLVKILLAFLVSVPAVYPAIKHIIEYKSPTVFFSKEVEVLERLKGIADREDYVLAWWDYGYPIRYYADVKTLIDGGKHLGHHNFPVSFSLTKDQVSSANMARVEVEYTQRDFKERFSSKIDQILQDYNLTDVDDLFLLMSSEDFKTPQKTRDIYYYLPRRMMDIYNVIPLFSNIDLKTGKSKDGGFFLSTYPKKPSQDGLLLANGFVISHDLKTLKVNDQTIPIKSFYETKYDDNHTLVTNEIKLDKNGILSIICSKDDGLFVIVDDTTLNSTYIQLFLLENYDSRFFEPVILSPYAKVYKLKI